MKKTFCPHCRRRLFDINYTGEVEVEIKCPKCSNIVKLNLGKESA